MTLLDCVSLGQINSELFYLISIKPFLLRICSHNFNMFYPSHTIHKYCDIWHLSLSVTLGQSIIFPFFLFSPCLRFVFNGYLSFFFTVVGKFDWCQWRQSAGGSNPSLPAGDTLRVFKCPWSPRFPTIRWRLWCRAFLRQRGSHFCGWLRQRNARNPGWEKFSQQTHPSPSCHTGSAASPPR